MTKVHTSPNHWEVGLLRAELEEKGIACAIKNETVSSIAGQVPWIDTWPELWVVNDVDLTLAQTVMADYQAKRSTNELPWKCPGCGEEIEAGFEACWNCGEGRPEEI